MRAHMECKLEEKDPMNAVAPPDVHVFVPKVSDDHSKLVLSCLATGFYPRDIEMNITLDGTVLGNQRSSGIRPNTDGSFQMRTSVEIDVNHKGFYDCLVIHSSLTLTRPILTVWTIYQQNFSVSITAGIAAAVVIFLSLIGYYQLKRSKDKHFIRYKFAAFCKANTHPVFKAVCVCDDRQIAQYSNEERVWKRSSRTEDDWINAPEEPESRDWFLHQLNTLSNCTDSQCSELHVLQRTIGCELEKRPDGSEKSLRVFDEYGFDGEDFIAFNSDTLQWIDKNPKAKETKREWDQQTERNQFLQHYLKNCINWISTFNNTKMTPPDVHVFVPKVSDDHSKLVLSCLATGFYPRDIEMNITLDGTVLGNQISSGIRPNTDGSFQMRTSVEIDVNHKGFYDCLVIHSSLTLARPILTVWTIYQ
ncbi:H-2 class I histocompatibility antigen, K-B alpha chain-like [Onychostoma macrolepis]|uniref:H-2 class I histocompatibility antigen, K-B alpha chain-like n=1 Tax=Onychostoma macrolepis TaxID=369639 RepID=UPI00272A6A56|nr:H-2 class I histocompatibility antigen, K-B alpha chain-like [Onychostoma macrolepis]